MGKTRKEISPSRQEAGDHCFGEDCFPAWCGPSGRGTSYLGSQENSDEKGSQRVLSIAICSNTNLP